MASPSIRLHNHTWLGRIALALLCQSRSSEEAHKRLLDRQIFFHSLVHTSHKAVTLSYVVKDIVG